MATKDNPCRVLIVDDDKLLRDKLKLIIQGLGANVVGESDNGADALQAYETHTPDITFLDIDMPRKNGIIALKDIVQKDPNAFVVMLTATSDMDIADSCLELGASSYVRKGVEPHIMELMLKNQIEAVKAG